MALVHGCACRQAKNAELAGSAERLFDDDKHRYAPVRQQPGSLWGYSVRAARDCARPYANFRSGASITRHKSDGLTVHDLKSLRVGERRPLDRGRPKVGDAQP